jgi:hypothetical protein
VRLRKLFGAVALFVLVIVWALIAMAVAQFPAIRDNTVLSILYYVVAGLDWILPAMPLVSLPDSHTTSINGITLWILEALKVIRLLFAWLGRCRKDAGVGKITHPRAGTRAGLEWNTDVAHREFDPAESLHHHYFVEPAAAIRRMRQGSKFYGSSSGPPVGGGFLP